MQEQQHDSERYYVTYSVKDGEGKESNHITTLKCDGSQASCELLVLELAEIFHPLPVQVMIDSIVKKD